MKPSFSCSLIDKMSLLMFDLADAICPMHFLKQPQRDLGTRDFFLVRQVCKPHYWATGQTLETKTAKKKSAIQKKEPMKDTYTLITLLSHTVRSRSRTLPRIKLTSLNLVTALSVRYSL